MMARTQRGDSKTITARLTKLRDAERPKPIVKALQAIDRETEALKLDQLSERLRMIRVLLNLQEIVEVYGIARFFMESPEPLGAYAHDAVGWCNAIGAARAATYLERALALFPHGSAPSDGAAGLLAVDKIEEAAPNAFLDLDEEFKDAEAEIPDLLRRYLLDHETDLSLALTQGLAAVRSAQTLPSILATRDPLEFLEKLVDLFAPASGAERMVAWASPKPNAATMLQVLHAFYLDVEAEGIANFLSSPRFGGFATDAARWLRALRSDRSAEYLDAAVALFPSRKIPRDADKRCDVVEQLIDNHRGAGSDPFRQLDEQYPSATEEMVSALRVYVRDHAETPLPALESLAQASSNAS